MSAPNRLAGESSLYLRQHSLNPVNWFPWGDEAIAAAKASDKPIFLSIGYSACHWCHVMEHESFEDDDTAKVMNELFVNVKVDREERPDLDQIYMTSLQLLTREGGGWPLSVFLTPDLTPFYAGTYFPPKDMYGRPSFRRVLLAVAESWKTKREHLTNLGKQVQSALQESLTVTSNESELTEETLRKALAALKRNYDTVHGGFGRAPKFPHPVDLRLLLRLYHRFKDPEALQMVTHTLTMMARGGIYDQIGGGFHRYSVDEKWLVPHFEKMLYDNALLVPVFVEANQITGNSYFGMIANQTLRYVYNDMQSPGGGFYSTEDADSEGEEGKYYVWKMSEVEAILAKDSDLAKHTWGISSIGNFEGHNILFRRQSDEDDAKLAGLTVENFQKKLGGMIYELKEARDKRVRPGRDQKILTAWNGLMIAAFSSDTLTSCDGEHRDAAIMCANLVHEKHCNSEGRLFRTCSDEQPAKLAAYLEDYAYLIDALLDLYNTDFDAKWITTACKLADVMIADYFDAENGGFYFTVKDKTDLIARTKDWHDGATPSGNAVAATALLKLAIFCDRLDYRDTAVKTLKAFSGLVNDNPAAAAQMLIALDWKLGPVQEVAIVGPRDDSRKILSSLGYSSRRIVATHDPAGGNPPANIALLRGKTMIGDQVTTYICRNYQCDAPLVGVDAAIKALSERCLRPPDLC